MKKHNIFKVVLITILVLMLLTWILPAAYYQNGYIDQGRIQMGLFDLFNYPITTISYFGYLALYVLVVGGLYGVLNKISAYRVFLDKLVATFKGKEKIVLSVLMVLLAVLTSVCGLQIGLVVFIPMLISLILLMGFDKTTAALAIVGSLMIGVAGSTFGYTNTNVIASTLGTKITSEMISKIVILIAGMALLIMNTMFYIKKAGKTKKTTKKTAAKKTTKSAAKTKDVVVSKDDEYVPAKVSGRKKVTVWPLAVMICLLFVVLVLSFISWSGAFNVKAFENATKSVLEFKLFGFAIFGKILGSVNAFGAWTATEMIVVTVLTTLLLSFIYKVNFDDMIDGFVEGAKKAALPALVVVLAYTCLVIATYHPFQLVIYKALLGMTKGFNIVTGSIVAIISSAINVDPSYTFQSVLPYLTSVVTDKAAYPVVGLVFQSVYGLTMLVAPTSIILMGVLAYLDIPYTKWLKTIWKLFVELFVVLLVVFLIVVLV
ncbi:MAG: hypothetical protein IJF92_02380 [Bacilli bacterium]|nr:hypothetical protein [Bacilli bacterium]